MKKIAGKYWKIISKIISSLAIVISYAFNCVCINAEDSLIINDNEKTANCGTILGVSQEANSIDQSSVSIILMDGSYIERIESNHDEFLLLNGNIACEDSYDIYIDPIDLSSYINTGNGRVNENVSALSYAISGRATVYYEVFSSSNDNDYGRYYRINSFSFVYTGIESPCTLSSTVLRIENNGISEGSGVTNQYSQSQLGTASSGTVYGSSSWIPTCSGEYYYTKTLMSAVIYRGSSTYNIGWSYEF